VAGAERVILDTCALLWLAQGGGALSAAALQRIDAAPVVYVSAISGFEIGIKVQKGKLHLPVPPADWFTAVLSHHHLDILVLNLDVCLRSTMLPPLHADPCDRMIIAAAQIYHLPVVTTDPRFAQYGIEVIS
jgi:PIN domain nuclease of toxin-antitoxin system